MILQQILLASVFFVEILVIATWFRQHVEMRRIRRDGLWVTNRGHTDEENLPSLTVVVPARNEAGRIGECLRSILSQDHPRLGIIIADDRSGDDTAGICRRIAAGDDRLMVHTVTNLPPGWLGKSHALWSAAQQAQSDWLLFLDADCRLLPNGLRSAAVYALERKVDFLSLWPRDGSRGFWEHLLIPLCGAMIVIWYGSRRVNDPKYPHAFANGQFILVHREAYLRFGGHEAVKDAIIEDVPLARCAKAAGLSVLTALGSDIYQVRMYESLREIVRGWRRIYLGVLTRRQLILSMMSILVGSLLPYVMIPIAIATVASPDASGWWRAWLYASVIHLLALLFTSIRFFGLARCRLRYLVFYPLSCLGVLGILGGAFMRSFGCKRVDWRQTTYDVEGATIQG